METRNKKDVPREKKEVEMSLFADDLILDTTDLRTLVALLEHTAHKIGSFPCTNDERTEKVIKKAIYLQQVQHNKMPRNKHKEVKDLYNENFKTRKTEIEGDARGWKDLLTLMDR